MPASLDQARAVLAAQPFSRLLGAQLNTFGLDGIELEVPVRPAHRQQQGRPWRAARLCRRQRPHLRRWAVVGPGVLTAGYTINLLAPVVGDRLVTRAVVVSAGQRLITAGCELIEPHPEHDRVCAIAQGTIARTG
jgi:acyl-coenzyme A thioesterase PaaI-like protein